MPYLVQRNGKLIGDHDEKTLLALLNAGLLRATDTYLGRGMVQPEPLSSLLGRGTRWHSARTWLIASAVSAVAGLLWLLPPPAKPQTPQMIEAKGQRSGHSDEVRRGFPIIRGSISQVSRAAFPLQNVESRASHSRVAILALDANDAPLGLAAGFVMGQGNQVVTALRAVSGASAVEIRYANGESTRATGVIVDQERGIAILSSTQTAIPMTWSETAPLVSQELFIASHGLMPSPALTEVRSATPDQKPVLYRLDTALPVSALGSAALNAAGDVSAIVVKPESGLILAAADVRSLLRPGLKPQGMETLIKRPPGTNSPLVVVDSAVIEDGVLLVQLRNTSGAAIRQALLHIRYHEQPRTAMDSRSLEQELARTAVEACTLEYEEPGSDRYFQKKQQLREVTTRLEFQRRAASEELKSARQRVYRTDVLSVEAALPPGLPQRIAIEAGAGSSWGAVVSVLDVMFE